MIRMTTTRKAAIAVFLATCILPCVGQKQSKAPAGPASWLLTYQTGHSTIALQADPRFRALLRQNLPQQALFIPGHRSIADAIRDFTGDEPIVLRNRYVTIDGCARHACPELQGFLWIDTKSSHPDVIFAALTEFPSEGTGTNRTSFYHLWIYRNQPLRQDFLFTADALPDEFIYSLRDNFDRTGERQIVSAILVGSDGMMTPMLPSKLHLSGISGQLHKNDPSQE